MQSHFLRKLGRGKSDDDPSARPIDQFYSNNDIAFDEASEETLVYDAQRTQRAGSEPSEQLLSSIPLHVRTKRRAALTRNVSDADTFHSGSSDSHPISSGEPGPSIIPVETLGLSLLHRAQDAAIDFIFVHGLGGSSLKTWSFKRDPRNFWPLWLPKEPELSHIRIFSFGYDADFRGGSTSLNITDFAKDLLFQMLTFTGNSDNDADAGVGQVCRFPSSSTMIF